tara:strand:- start:409338 stop:409865 length:528 start_codon:yes stop_codon:yes gene_type:complete
MSAEIDQLVEALSKLLRVKGQTLATVESCTGGLVGAAMTGPAGASDVFVGGLLTYSNEAKEALAGVRAATLKAHGAVSGLVAIEMASGGRARLGADIAVSITGIAGPGGGSDEKPVGTVWVCVDRERGQDCRRFVFPGDREAVRAWSVVSALGMVIQVLTGQSEALSHEFQRFGG